jgi:MFS family permease
MNSASDETVIKTATKSSGPFYGWYVVAASIVGLSLGYSVVAVMAFGTFINPLQEAFGWSRGQISLGVSIIGYTAIFVFPLAGMLVDRIGAKKVLIPSTLLFGATMASMSLMTPSLWHFYGMCVLIPIMGSGTAPLTYSRLIVAWFDKKRGLALGVGLAGVGLGTALVPIIATWIMDNWGWREAYLGIGLMIIVLVIPVAWIVMCNSPREKGLLPDGETVADHVDAFKPKSTLLGFTAKEALKRKSFWLMIGSFAIAGLTTSTVLIHMIPLMMDRGMDRGQAAGAFAYLGMALLVGRLLAGYLMDKIFAPWVVIVFLFGPVIGLALLASGATGTTAALCAALVGMAIGAEFDVMAFFTSRYFGPRNFGQIYGYNYSAFKVGAATGPLIMGIAYDMVGRYDEILWSMSGIMMIACVLVGLMPKYPTLPLRDKTEVVA